MLAGMKSEQVAGFVSESVAGFSGIRRSSRTNSSFRATALARRERVGGATESRDFCPARTADNAWH